MYPFTFSHFHILHHPASIKIGDSEIAAPARYYGQIPGVEFISTLAHQHISTFIYPFTFPHFHILHHPASIKIGDSEIAAPARYYRQIPGVEFISTLAHQHISTFMYPFTFPHSPRQSFSLSVIHTPHPMPHAPCPMLHAPCSMLHAPCSMLHALCPLPSAKKKEGHSAFPQR